jgi:uncharacterized protein (TIGR02186 family)
LKKNTISFVVLAIGLSLFAQGSLGERLTVNMTTHEIAITSNFTGATITLFGAIQKIADPNLVPHPLTLVPIQPKQGPVEDIVVVIKGPPEDVTVRRKERVAGVWVNNNSMTFKNVPGFYFVASTQPLDLIADEALRARNEVGADHLALTVDPEELEGFTEAEARDFRAALFRRKTASGLYGIDERGVVLQDRTLFNMRLKIPANVPVGEYVAQILLLRDGKVVGSQPLYPRVEKSGIERWIYTIAHSIPFVYGFIAVGLAALAGWTASLIFRQK